MSEPIRVGIVGSREYTNKTKIKDFIFNLKKKYNENLVIVSGGCPDGADAIAKKYALEFEVGYEEYPPSHARYNSYCVLSDNNYGKSYNVRNFFDRNKLIARYSDLVVSFIPEGVESNGSKHTLKEADKLNKKTLIIQ